jgi:hypothetical protein
MSVLLLERAISRATAFQVAQGFLPLVGDTIEFREPAGGQASRELAIPFLRDMDEVSVARSELRLRARAIEIETHDYTAAPATGGGVVLRLPQPGLLKRVVLDYTPPAPTPPSKRLVVRLAEGSSVPIFANPGMDPLGPMYGPALPGFNLRPVANGNAADLPSVLGSAWLFQWAQGDAPDKLAPLNIPIRIVSVVLDAVPRDVNLVLVGSEEVPLWSSPGLLLPSAGEQLVSFSPLAQRHLTEKLKAATKDTATLGASLKFYSSSAGALDIVAKTLEASYVSRPFGTAAKTIRLAGDRAEFPFDVPSGPTPREGSFRITLKPSGRERDTASPEGPAGTPVQGWKASQTVHAAASLARADDAAVIGVRTLLQVPEKAEAVLEARADVGGSPGAIFGQPAVRQLTPGAAGWVEFRFPEPLTPETSTVWFSLRTNQGSVLWFADALGGGTPKLSFDQGKSWGVPEAPLTGSAQLVAQLIRPADPLRPPAVQLRQGLTVHSANLLAGATGVTTATAPLPPSLLAAPAATGKTTKRFELASATIGDAVIEDFVITYKPEF